MSRVAAQMPWTGRLPIRDLGERAARGVRPECLKQQARTTASDYRLAISELRLAIDRQTTLPPVHLTAGVCLRALPPDVADSTESTRGCARPSNRVMPAHSGWGPIARALATRRCAPSKPFASAQSSRSNAGSVKHPTVPHVAGTLLPDEKRPTGKRILLNLIEIGSACQTQPDAFYDARWRDHVGELAVDRHIALDVASGFGM